MFASTYYESPKLFKHTRMQYGFSHPRRRKRMTEHSSRISFPLCDPHIVRLVGSDKKGTFA